MRQTKITNRLQILSSLIVVLFMFCITPTNAQEITLPMVKTVWNGSSDNQRVWYSSTYYAHCMVSPMWNNKNGVYTSSEIIYDNNRYYLRLNFANYKGFYVADMENVPYAFLEDASGKTFELKCHEQDPIVCVLSHKKGASGVGSVTNMIYGMSSSATWDDFPDNNFEYGKARIHVERNFYITSFLYVIPDIEEFLSLNYIGFRLCDDEVKYIANAEDKYMQRFNSNLKKAVNSVRKQMARQTKHNKLTASK